MKIIHYINSTVYSVFFVLSIIGIITKNESYIIILGHIILGILQPILGLILLSFSNSFIDKKKKLLSIYWLLVIAFFTIITIVGSLKIEYELIIRIFSILPVTIATYFVYVTYSIKLK